MTDDSNEESFHSKGFRSTARCEVYAYFIPSPTENALADIVRHYEVHALSSNWNTTVSRDKAAWRTAAS